jgi:hypothetical protein
MKHPVPPKPKPTRAGSVEPLLAGRRAFVPIRTTIAQTGKGRDSKPNKVLPALLRAGSGTLEQYLLTLAAASTGGESGSDYTLKQPSARLARAAGHTEGPAGMRALNRAWTRLADLRLVQVDTSTRPSTITLLREDGSGEPYVRPSITGAEKERFLKLPYAYWQKGWNEKLETPAKILLLVALTLDDYFLLPKEKGREWYALSPSTVQRGLAELVKHELLDVCPFWKATPYGPREQTLARRYRLAPPFGPSGRIAANAEKDLDYLNLERTPRSSTTNEGEKRDETP